MYLFHYFCQLPRLTDRYTCSTGGVEVLTPNGKIKAVNTMESRLEMLNKQVLTLSPIYNNILYYDYTADLHIGVLYVYYVGL